MFIEFKMISNQSDNKIKIADCVAENGIITKVGTECLKKLYDRLITNYGFVVGCAQVYYDDNDRRGSGGYHGKKIQDEKKNHILQKSYFYPSRNVNVLTVHMGPQYGGLIGIDIDVKGEKKDAIKVFEYWLKQSDTSSSNTFGCTTPSGGRHYIYYLDKVQQRSLSKLNFSSGQLGLFDRDIDVLYNHGRFYMAGFVRKSTGVKQYKIINNARPARLPDMIFTEIVIRIKGRTIKKTHSLTTPDKKKSKLNIIQPGKNVPTDEALVIELLKCLNPIRSNKYEEWIKICMILVNEYIKFEVFDEWSKTCPEKYDPIECRKYWDRTEINNNGCKIGTLILYAKEDNYNNYYTNVVKKMVKKKANVEQVLFTRIAEHFKKNNEEYNESHMNLFMRLIIRQDGMSLAKFFKDLFPDDYVYDSCRKTWYSANKYGIFDEDTDELLSARTKLSTIVLDIFKKYMTAFLCTFPEDQKDQKAHYVKYSKRIQGELTRLSSKKTIIETLKELYIVKRLMKKMNPNKFLFVFNNGVYDMNAYTFRNAKKEELVCTACGYKYKPSTEEDRSLILRTIKDMFLKDELYEYFMTIISIRLVCINELEEFYFLIGNASNGKGLITTLIQETFGERSQILESSSFYKNRHGVSANAASPELASTKDSNIVFINELDRETKLTADNIKKLTGNDKIKVRFLRQNCFEFIPGYSLFFVSNHEPEIDGDDFGIQRRLRFIPFNVTFKDDPVEPNERKINRGLKQLFRQDKYKCAFFDILVEFYKNYAKNFRSVEKKLEPPEEVKCRSQQYLENNDPVLKFVNDRLTITTDPKDVIPAKQMMEMFVAYHAGDARGYKAASLKKRLCEFGIDSKKTKSCNVYYRVKEKQDDDVIDIVDDDLIDLLDDDF